MDYYKKEDEIFSASIGNQKLYYFDDVCFLNENNDEFLKKFKKPVIKISEITPFIEEFTVGYLNNTHFENDGSIYLRLGSYEYPLSKKPQILNDDSLCVELCYESRIQENVDGSSFFVYDFTLRIEILKPIKTILSDIKELEYISSFNIFKSMKKRYNLIHSKDTDVLISSMRLNLLFNVDHVFMILEYANLRKDALLSEKRAFYTINSVYTDFYTGNHGNFNSR